MDYTLLNTIADADTDSKYWGSAVQDKAQEILSIIAGRSWCDDDVRADDLLAWAEYEYQEFIRLMKQASKAA